MLFFYWLRIFTYSWILLYISINLSQLHLDYIQAAHASRGDYT
ncbi:hypothetical protein L667_27450 [Escherichia coli 95JB1]|nr:hypothetical protein L668_00065 [Escherichia coli 95NR1]ERE09625.1 hypothetical protein L667_27450 [Escherichia coli 95JB1]ETD62091.1 hypothetical protein Q458_20290 [Escherichia coli ATCC BAA-2209]